MHKGSVVVPTYLSGEYFRTLAAPDQDAEFKATAFLKLLARVAKRAPLSITSYVDVGCGGGGTAKAVLAGLVKTGFSVTAKGYDVSPHVANLRIPGIEFVWGDFCDSEESCDLATAFDVFEHVPDPIQFMRDVAARSRYVVFHIPLDDTLANALLDRYRRRIEYPGHLIYLNPASALNLVTMAGLLIMDYDYTFGFRAPSGKATALQKTVYPVRYLLSKLSPWLSSRAVGGVSLMVIAMNPRACMREDRAQ